MIRYALLLMSVPLSLVAQAPRDSVLSATVSRTVRLTPDRSTFFLSVEGTAETAKDAVTRAEARITTVREALQRVGPGVEVGPPVAMTVGAAQGMRGFLPAGSSPPSFVARIALRVNVTRLAVHATALAAALDAGAAQSASPTFDATSADSVRLSVAAAALSAARREVEATAAGLGGRVGHLVDASTNGSFPSVSSPDYFNFDVGFAQQWRLPEVAVTVTATVRYRLIK